MAPSCAAFGALQPQQQLTALAGTESSPRFPKVAF